MIHRACFRLSPILGATAIAWAMATLPAAADSLFTATSDGFVGQVRAGAAQQGAAAVAGSKAVISGERLVPGQEITLMRGTTVLNPDGPLVVDGEGNFSFQIDIDAEALTGLQPIVVIGENPAAAMVADLKISPVVPLSGAENYTITSEKVTPGLYQVIYSHANDTLFVTSAVGRPPVKESTVTRIDPATLAVVAQASPPAAPARDDGTDGGLFAAYGVAVDDTNGNVWVTNTRQDTIAVYTQDGLALVKQFAPGAVQHSRDVVVDEARGRAYASATGTGNIEVFDTRTLEQLEPIVIRSGQRGGEFSAMSLDLDAEGGKLVTVSLSTDEAALVDLASRDIKVIPLPGAKSASGVAYDPVEGLIFAASQATDNLLIVKAEDGTVLHDVETGAGPLNVTFEPVSRTAFVANRGSGTITVVDTSGNIVANLDAGSFPNQLRADGKGNVWAVNKSRGEDDPDGDRIWKIVPGAGN